MAGSQGARHRQWRGAVSWTRTERDICFKSMWVRTLIGAGAVHEGVRDAVDHVFTDMGVRGGERRYLDVDQFVHDGAFHIDLQLSTSEVVVARIEDADNASFL